MKKAFVMFGCLMQLAVAVVAQAQVQTAGTLYVQLYASSASAGAATWTNSASLGNFTKVGSPALSNDVAGSGIPGVYFNGTSDAYQGPNSVADLDGASDRSIEVWAYNPALLQEETTVSWGHRGFADRDLAFNFGNNGTWGAATHWDDDVSWGAAAPSAVAWHHLVYTYSNQVARVYIDGGLANSKNLTGPLNTFAGEPINLACQRDSANGPRSLWYSGYLNTVRIHGGVLTASQILNNYQLGPATGSLAAPTGLKVTAGYNEVYLQWNAVGGASYRVKRATAVGGPYVLLATNLVTTNYLDSGLLTGVEYFYEVSAASSTSISGDSSPVSAILGVPTQPLAAGTLQVDLRSADVSASGAVWTNRGALTGNFLAVGAPVLSNNVAGSGIPGVYFNGTTDAYQGPNSLADLDGGSDRSIEVWAYNPDLAQEETTVSWGHRGSVRQDVAFNFGNNEIWGAATHWDDDVSWGNAPPDAGAWQHLIYLYENSAVRVYVNGELRNSKILAGPLNTYAGEPIHGLPA